MTTVDSPINQSSGGEPERAFSGPPRPKFYLLPLMGLLAILVVGMAFSFWWLPVIHHVQAWATPPDLWGTFRDAHYVIWNGEGAVYNANTSFVTFPGIAVLLAPVAEIQRAFNLTESFPVYLPKPTAWLFLGPVNMLCGGVLLFPLDMIARRLSITSKRRIIFMWLEAALIWPTVALWGHPEDTLALTFGFVALVAAYDRRWVRTGCFMALAVVFQPLILLILPIMLAYVPFKKWPALAAIIALPSLMLLLAPLVQEWGPTTFAIFKQPNFPYLNHPTPWLALAPVLSKGGEVYVDKLYYTALANGHHKLVYGPVKTHIGNIVAAGPGRIISLVLACAIGLWVARRKPPLSDVMWFAAIALSLRCIFECVMDPYYLLPALALALLVAAKASNARFALVIFFGAVCTWLSYWKTGEWTYYLLVTGTLLAAIALAKPSKAIPNSSSPGVDALSIDSVT